MGHPITQFILADMAAGITRFACTTNLIKKLDRATLRRFIFKISLGYLAAQRANTMLRAWCGLPTPAALSSLDILTRGDFAVA